MAVDPGQAAAVSDVAIDFEGDIARTSDPDAVLQREEIRNGWRLPVGRPFTQSSWDDAKAQAVRQLVARRYPAGRMSYSLADIDAPARAHLGLRLDSGPLYRLGAMQVSGVERYDPVLVPRLARLPPGSIYDQQRILEAQLRLASSGYFDSAFILVDPESDPNAAPPQVTVREAPLQKFVFGVGLTTDSGPRLSVEHTHNRMPLPGMARGDQIASGSQDAVRADRVDRHPRRARLALGDAGAGRAAGRRQSRHVRAAAAVRALCAAKSTSTATCMSSTSAPPCRPKRARR